MKKKKNNNNNQTSKLQFELKALLRNIKSCPHAVQEGSAQPIAETDAVSLELKLSPHNTPNHDFPPSTL